MIMLVRQNLLYLRFKHKEWDRNTACKNNFIPAVKNSNNPKLI